MSQGPETTFIKSVHRHLPKGLYAIKNHNIYNSGQPDCWYSGNAADLWIEYKFIVIPKRPNTLITFELSELQKNWLRSRHAEGRSVGVIVGCKEGGVFLAGESWGSEITADYFRKIVQSRSALADAIALHCTQ